MHEPPTTRSTMELAPYIRAVTIQLRTLPLSLANLVSTMGDVMPGFQKTGTKRTYSRRESTGAQPLPVDASLFRALVAAKGDAHKRDHYIPASDRDTSTTLSKFHLSSRNTALPHARLAAVSDFEFKPNGLNRDLLLKGTTTRAAWEKRAKEMAAKNGEEGVPLLVTLFGPRISAAEAGTTVDLVCEVLERTYKCSGLEGFAFQLDPDVKDLDPSAGRTIAVFGISTENGKAAAARYAHCASIDDDTIIAFGVHLWDGPPNTHVATLEKVNHIRAPTDKMREAILAHIKEHICARSNDIGAFLTGNAKLFWESGTLSHDWLPLLLDSLHIELIVDVGPKGDRSVIINIYALGVFADQWSVDRWADQLIGKTVNLGNYGTGVRAVKRLHCSYCHDTDHYVRICRIPKHAAWFQDPNSLKKPKAKPEDASWTTVRHSRKPNKETAVIRRKKGSRERESKRRRWE